MNSEEPSPALVLFVAFVVLQVISAELTPQEMAMLETAGFWIAGSIAGGSLVNYVVGGRLPLRGL